MSIVAIHRFEWERNIWNIFHLFVNISLLKALLKLPESPKHKWLQTLNGVPIWSELQTNTLENYGASEGQFHSLLLCYLSLHHFWCTQPGYTYIMTLSTLWTMEWIADDGNETNAVWWDWSHNLISSVLRQCIWIVPNREILYAKEGQKREVLWYNPHFSQQVTAKIGKLIFEIMNKGFAKHKKDNSILLYSVILACIISDFLMNNGMDSWFICSPDLFLVFLMLIWKLYNLKTSFR